MKFAKIITAVIIVVLPFAGYFAINVLSKKSIVLPKKYFYDTVMLNSDGPNDTIWHKIAPIKLANQFADSVDITDLRGKVLIVNTFFTHCPSICDKLSKRMYQLQESIVWKDKRSINRRETVPVHLLSISIDPKRDKPKVLNQYASKYRANNDVWWFLTGKKRKVYDYIIDQFKLGVVDGDNVDSNFIHSQKLILIDRHLVIRGYYDGLDETSVSKLANDAGLLILEKD